jgi:hypothetical protein
MVDGSRSGFLEILAASLAILADAWIFLAVTPTTLLK